MDHAVLTVGSSPRMRGALALADRVDRETRIIPAYAGSTTVEGHGDAHVQDHPRVCGEHDMKGDKLISMGGIIPAYAGSTAALVPCGGLFRDHPRVCGEHPHMYGSISPSVGSSPRMRGARTPFLLPSL